MPFGTNLVTTVSPDYAGAPPEGVAEKVARLLYDWEDIWCVFLLDTVGGARWGFYRGHGRSPLDYQSHDLKNPTLARMLADEMAIIMINSSLPRETYSMYATDATLKHSVQYGATAYAEYTAEGTSGSSSE